MNKRKKIREQYGEYMLMDKSLPMSMELLASEARLHFKDQKLKLLAFEMEGC